MTKLARIHIACCVASAALLLAGLTLVVTHGFDAPPWLLRAEVATLSLLALVGGFSAALPSLRSLATLLRLRPVRGAVLVALGVSAMYLPPQLIASAVFLFFGIRLVWASACELTDTPEALPETVAAVTEIVPPGDDPAMLTAASRELARRPARRDAAPAPACRDGGR